MGYKTKKPKEAIRKDVRYDWLLRGEDPTDVYTSREFTTPMNGVFREMTLRPVRVDADTGSPLEGKAGTWSKESWGRAKVTLVWLWPNARVKTLLSLLEHGRLTGRAAQDVTALKDATDSLSSWLKLPSSWKNFDESTLSSLRAGSDYDSHDWARYILVQEKDDKLREGKREREKNSGRTVRGARSSASSSGSRKQKPSSKGSGGKTVERKPAKGRPASSLDDSGGASENRRVSGKAARGPADYLRARRAASSN